MTAQQVAAVQGISLAEAAQGGLIDDIDVAILDAAFCQWNYNGGIDHDILALGIQYQDGDGKTYDQYYSAGELSFFVPSDDGSMAVPVADKRLLSDSCNAWKFLASLMECGLPPETLATGDVKQLVGMNVHVKQFAQPKRQGLIRGGEEQKDKQVLLVVAINSMPGEAAPAAPKKIGVAGAGKPVGARPTPATSPAAKPGLGKPATSAAAKPGIGTKTAASTATKPSPSKLGAGKVNGQAGAATAAAGDDEKAVAQDILMGILLEAGGTITKKDLATASFRKCGEKVTAGEMDAKTKTKMVQLIFQDPFLHEIAESGVITYDGSVVNLAA